MALKIDQVLYISQSLFRLSGKCQSTMYQAQPIVRNRANDKIRDCLR